MSDHNLQDEQQLINQLAAKKPDTQFNPAFSARLKQELQNKPSLAKTDDVPFLKKLTDTLSMKKFTFAFGALAVVVLAVLVSYPSLFKTKSPSQITQQILSNKFAINSLPEQAFGALNAQNVRNQSGGGGMGGGGTASAGLAYEQNSSDVTMSAPAMAPSPENKIANPGMGGGIGIMPPYYQPYRFVYKGSDIASLLADKQPVLRRITGFSNTSPSDLLSRYSFGLLDFTKFQNTKLQNFSFVEDKNEGYIVSVDLTQSTVNIYQNWEKWPRPEMACQSEECYRQYMVKISQIPQDSELIKIAGNFLADFGISTEGYGPAKVNNDWRVDYERSADKSMYYIPEQAAVVYPLLIEGKAALDQGGNPTGLMISIDVRSKKVSNVYGLTNRQFDKSEYEGETDAGKIIKLAESGGWNNYLPLAADSSYNDETQTIELQTPTVELVQVWHYDGNTGRELYAPALVFPVGEIPNSQQSAYYYWPRKVIVPLVKELLDQNQMPIGIMKDAVPPTEPRQ